MKNEVDTTESNKLIAEFMGGEDQSRFVGGRNEIVFNKKSHSGITTGKFFGYNALLYHSDWNWLMQVVEKIFSEECIKPLAGNGMYYVLEINIEEALKTAKIKLVYNACVEFVTWYNENSAKEN